MNRVSKPRWRVKKQQIVGILALLWACTFIMPQGVVPAAAIMDVEDIIIIEGLENNTYTWRLDKALGIFAADDLHPGNMLQAKVTEADPVHFDYLADYYILAWGNTTYIPVSSITNSQYFFVERHWTNVSRFMILPQCISYWQNDNLVGAQMEIKYAPEFIHGNFIDTVTIQCNWNETNWFRAKFTRAEGILLTLDVKVLVPGGLGEGQDLRGDLIINHDSQSYGYTLTLWHWVIWFLVIVGSVVAVIMVISILVSRRKAAAMRLNY